MDMSPELKLKIYASLKHNIIGDKPLADGFPYQQFVIIFKDSYNGIMDILNDE